MEQLITSDIEILYKSILLIIDRYQHHYLMPDWLLRVWHPRIKQMNYIKNKIESAWNSHNDRSKLEDEFIKILDNDLYFFSTHTNSKRLRGVIQDAMVTCLFFTNENIEAYRNFVITQNNPQAYIESLQQNDELQRYQTYYRKQHSIYGRFVERLTTEEVKLAAKGGMINGKLIDRYGSKSMLEHGLHYIRRELKELQKKHLEVGYLKLQVIVGYIEKMDFLLHPANELQNDETALIQNARYLLEDVMNAAGVENEGVAVYPEHKPLIAGCLWVDELFKMIKIKVDLESL